MSSPGPREEGIHTHLAEVREEKTAAQLRWGRSTVEHANEIGILGANCVAGHGVWLSAAEMEMIAESEGGDHLQPHRQHDPGVRRVPARRACGARRLARHRYRRNGQQRQPQHDRSAENRRAPSEGASQNPEAADARQVLRMGTIDGARCLGAR